MRVVHVSASDGGGGAARAAYRLHQALRADGVDSKMVVARKTTQDPFVYGPTGLVGDVLSTLSAALEWLPVKAYGLSVRHFSPGFFTSPGVVRQVNSLNPDVVHLHWIAGGALGIRGLRRLAAPLVWTLHDMWPFTGGCHYDRGCGRHREGCGRCPILGSSSRFDLSRLQAWRKRRAISRMGKVRFIGSSSWIAAEAGVSLIARRSEIEVHPNPVDHNVFAPVEKSFARRVLGLPTDVPLLLFVAAKPTTNPVKGFDHLVDAIERLRAAEANLVLVGAVDASTLPMLPVRVHVLGELHDDVSLTLAYSAADVAVVPSVQDNAPLVVSEAMACGTPVVAFSIGGLPDLVRHRETGFLASPFDPVEFATGIDWVLAENREGRIGAAARESVVRRYDPIHVARAYVRAYESSLS